VLEARETPLTRQPSSGRSSGLPTFYAGALPPRPARLRTCRKVPVITTQSATAQYSSRPKDERYDSLDALHTAALSDARICKRADVPLSALEAVADGGNVAIRGKATGLLATLNAWSFSQVCRLTGVPAHYARTLPAELACRNLNHGISKASTDPAQLYLRQNGSLTLRAATTPVYSRYHDATFVDRLMKLRDVRSGLDLPPVWGSGGIGSNDGTRGGAYRGDRDCFVIMTDGGSIVNDPTVGGFGGGNGTMYRGVIGRNSEVGGSKLELLTFYFRGICGNHCIWGVQNHTAVQRRHVGDVAAAFEEMITAAMRFFESPASADVEKIKALNAIELGADKKTVITAGREAGLTEDQATDSYIAAEQHEQNPRSVWGYSNGITRISQQSTYQDDRFALDLIAAKLLRRKVAA
jgi:hypothetical protein